MVEELTQKQLEEVEKYLEVHCLLDLKPYSVLFVEDEEFCIIRLRPGLIEVVPLTGEGFYTQVLLCFGHREYTIWLLDLGGEDWCVIIYNEKTKKIKIYYIDNWEFILNCIKSYPCTFCVDVNTGKIDIID